MAAAQVFCVPPYVGDVSRMLENMGVVRITVALRGWRYPEVDLTVEKEGKKTPEFTECVGGL